MQGQPAERRKPPGRSRWRLSGQSRAEPRGSEGRPGARGGRSSGAEEEEEEQQEEEEEGRLKTKISSNQQTEDAGRDEEVLGRGRGGGRQSSGRRAASEGEGGGEGRRRRLRWRINQLEKEKLELTSLHYKEVCALQAELTRLRSAVERGEAQGAELRYQLAVSHRDRDALAVRAARLQHAVDELLEAADAARRARLQDQHALQQAAEERHRVVEESERLHRELQVEEEALQEASRRREELETETQRLAKEVKVLMEREERSHKEKELLDQRIKSLQSNVEAERDAHLQTRCTCEVIQLRLRDTEAVLVVARSGQQEAQCSLELLRSQLREAQRAYSEEKESTEHALQRLQEELEHCQSELSVAVETERKTTSDLCDRLKEETRRHEHTEELLQEALQAHSGEQEASQHLLQQLSETLAPHCRDAQPAEHHGKWSPEETLQLLRTTMTSYQLQVDRSHKQVGEARSFSDRQQEEIKTLRLLCSQQEEQLQEAQQEVVRLQEEVSDWSAQSRELKAELQREKEKEEKEKEEQEEREKEMQEEREKEVQHLNEQQQAERMEGLSFLHHLYQRLLAGCVILPQPKGMLGNFTWQELCDVISEQVDQLTSDLQAANQKVVHLQFVCNKKTVCVRELQQNHKFVLLGLEESVRRREEAHTHTLTELQLHSDSLTSDLCASRARSSALLMACALLGGALRHAHGRLHSLCQQKVLLWRRLEEREQLEEEVRRLVEALRGDEEEEQEEERRQRRRRRAVMRWRRCVCVVLAVRRWRELGRRSTVLLWVEGGGVAPAAGVCGGGGDGGDGGDEDDEGDEGDEGGGVCARWLRSQRLSPAVMSSLSDLQAALRHHGSAHLVPAARSALSRLLRHFLHQSDVDAARRVPPPTDVKALVSALQQHFLLFSQRLHSAEVERRSLRLEVANLKRELQQEMVSAQRFHSVCEELRQALSREDEAQNIIREQRHTTQTVSQVHQELSRKERSLRIVGKHLSGVQRARRRAEGELSAAARRQDQLIGCLKAAEDTCRQVRDSLVQSRSSVTRLRPLVVSWEQLQLSGAESMMGTPEVAACQSFLSSLSQLCHTYSCRIEWLEQEVSAHRGHVSALRAELQDACLRDNQAFVAVAGFEGAFPLAETGSPASVLSSDSSKDLLTMSAPAQSH